MKPEINQYIEKRYKRWLDYSSFHCSRAGIADESADVLNEVVVALLEKDEDKLIKMYNVVKKGYREIDFFVLRMIKLNIYSATSPYQSRYKKWKYTEVEFSRLNICDEFEEEDDMPARILTQYNKVREIIDELNLSEKAIHIFYYRFFQEMPFSKWQGPEKKEELYETYGNIVKLIREKLNGKSLF